MKKFLFVSLAILFAIGTAGIILNAADKEYNWDQASKHIGESATITGKIVDNTKYNELTVLGMGTGVMQPGAVGIEIPESMKGQLPPDMYKGKTISVTGKIHKNPAGGASISVTDPSQIKTK